MDPSLRPISSNGRISARNSKLNIFLWNVMKTLTIGSMLLMVLSIYYTFIASEEDENRGGVLSAIIVLFALTSYTLIIPNLAQIAAVAIPYVEANRHISIRLLLIVVWALGGVKYPFLVYFTCSSLMTGVGLMKMYGDEGPTYKRVMDVIVLDVIQPCMSTFRKHEKKYGTGWAQCGTGLAMCGLFVMGYITRYRLPPLMEPERE